MTYGKLILKWIKGIFKHPIHILKGFWFKKQNKNRNLYIRRYKKCQFCVDLEYTPIGEVCGLCGCPLETKLRVPEEKCENKKW